MRFTETPRLAEMSASAQILVAGTPGVDWDGEFVGIIGQVELNGSLYLYYGGDLEFDVTEGTPAFRAIGVAISNDGGYTYQKYSGNPIIRWEPNVTAVEEGAVGGAVAKVGSTIHLYYGANTDVGGGNVDMAIRYRSSTDGVTFTGDTEILNNASHEYLPTGLAHDGTNYHLYYCHIDGSGGGAGGRGPVRKLSGTNPASLGSDTLVSSTHQTRVWVQQLASDLWIATCWANTSPSTLGVYRIDPASPAVMHGPVRNWFEGGAVISLAPYYDAATRRWAIFEHQWQLNGEFYRRTARPASVARFLAVAA